jgi:hypothetical protein
MKFKKEEAKMREVLVHPNNEETENTRVFLFYIILFYIFQTIQTYIRINFLKQIIYRYRSHIFKIK